MFLIRFRNHPVRFLDAPKAFEVVYEPDATRFNSVDEAYIKLVDWSLRGNGQFRVVPATMPERRAA